MQEGGFSNLGLFRWRGRKLYSFILALVCLNVKCMHTAGRGSCRSGSLYLQMSLAASQLLGLLTWSYTHLCLLWDRTPAFLARSSKASVTSYLSLSGTSWGWSLPPPTLNPKGAEHLPHLFPLCPSEFMSLDCHCCHSCPLGTSGQGRSGRPCMLRGLSSAGTTVPYRARTEERY